MRFSKNSKEIIDKISLISGIKKEVVKEVFESLGVLMVLDYAHNEITEIPLIGECEIEYKGENYADGLKEAILNGKISFDDFIVRNVGQICDKEETDAEHILENKIHSALGEYLNREV